MNEKFISLSWIKEYLQKLYAERDTHAKASMMWGAYNNSICVIQEMLEKAGMQGQFDCGMADKMEQTYAFYGEE